MNVSEAIFTRRSVRSYTPEVVAEPAIESLLRAAVQAPSAMNRQPWRFAIVQDRVVLKRYSERAKQMLLAAAQAEPKIRHYETMLRSDSFNVFYDAGTLIAIASETGDAFIEADCWLAAQNLMLAAHEAGLGSCCIGFALGLLNTEDVKAELRFGPDARVVAAIIVGRPTIAPLPVARAEPRIASWLRASASPSGTNTSAR